MCFLGHNFLIHQSEISGFYGPMCELKCRMQCPDGRCDPVYGYCTCEEGLYGENCDKLVLLMSQSCLISFSLLSDHVPASYSDVTADIPVSVRARIARDAIAR